MWCMNKFILISSTDHGQNLNLDHLFQNGLGPQLSFSLSDKNGCLRKLQVLSLLDNKTKLKTTEIIEGERRKSQTKLKLLSTYKRTKKKL